jgi:hypothetical protein
MGHCGEFFYALWDITANLVVRNGPLRRILLYTMGHCGGFGYALWATAQMMPYSKICIDFCTMGHSAGFGYALWAIAQGLVICYGP